MNKKIYITLVLLAFSTPLWAQLQSSLEDGSAMFPTSTGGSVVRNYNDEYAIGFFKSAGIAYFYSIPTNYGNIPFTSGLRIMVSPNWVVKDISFNEGEVFFCGSNGTDCLYGHFPVTDILNSTGIVHLVYRTSPIPMGSGSSIKDTLTRIVAYTYGGSSLNVTAIGYKNVVRDDFTGTVCNTLSITTSSQLTLSDMIMTNTLLYVGIDVANNSVVVMRAPIVNPLATDSTWHFKPSTPNTTILPSPIGCVVTQLSGDTVAVVHQCSNSNSSYEIDLLKIDISSMSCVSHQAYTNLHRVHLNDLKYLTITKRIVLLYNDYSDNMSHIMEWNPYSTTAYYANMLIPALRYSSLDKMAGETLITVSGYNWLLQDSQPTSWNYACEPRYLVQVIQGQSHNCIHNTPPDPDVFGVTTSSSTHPVSVFSISPSCVQ